MLIKVTYFREYKYLSLPDGFDRDQARRIAYTYVYRQPPSDYNDLVHNTLVLDVIQVPEEVVEYLQEG